jgi:hypothetical protein
MTKATLRHRNLDFLYGADETEGEKQKHKTAEISRHELQREELLGRYFDDEQTLVQTAYPASSAAGIMKRARETLYTKDFLPPPALLAKINDLTNFKRPTPPPLKGEVSLPSNPHRECIPCTSEFPGKVVGRWEGW